MIIPIRVAQDNPRTFIGITALLIILLATVMLFSSRSGSGIQLNNMDDTGPGLLQEDTYIMGWSSLAPDSVHIGETVNYQINITYDPAKVTPDINVFERSVDVMPLEKIQFSESTISLDDGLEKYVLNYRLQAVSVDIDTSYRLDPTVIYYTATGESVLQSLQIASPSIHITSYYPYDVSAIALNGVKGRVNAYSPLTRAILAISGILLLALCAVSLWMFCKRKPKSELSESEILWLEYQTITKNHTENRIRASDSERIFTRLLEVQTAIKPGMFWRGKDPEETFWIEIASKARSLLRTVYRPSGPDEKDVSGILDLLNEAFSFIVSKQKQMNLAEPSFFRRLINQKNIMFISTACLVTGLLMLVFAVWPGTWVPQNIQRYNELVDSVQNEDYRDEFATQFSELAKVIDGNRLKAASFYNSGTLIANNVQIIDEDQMLTEGGAFSDVAADQRVIQDAEDLLEILTQNVEKYRQSELHLRESVRAIATDENIRRNLELVIKRRKAVLHIINTLLATGHIQQVEIDELLNLLESQMALEFKVEEGQEAPGYYIGEEF